MTEYPMSAILAGRYLLGVLVPDVASPDRQREVDRQGAAFAALVRRDGAERRLLARRRLVIGGH